MIDLKNKASIVAALAAVLSEANHVIIHVRTMRQGSQTLTFNETIKDFEVQYPSDLLAYAMVVAYDDVRQYGISRGDGRPFIEQRVMGEVRERLLNWIKDADRAGLVAPGTSGYQAALSAVDGALVVAVQLPSYGLEHDSNDVWLISSSKAALDAHGTHYSHGLLPIPVSPRDADAPDYSTFRAPTQTIQEPRKERRTHVRGETVEVPVPLLANTRKSDRTINDIIGIPVKPGMTPEQARTARIMDAMNTQAGAFLDRVGPFRMRSAPFMLRDMFADEEFSGAVMALIDGAPPKEPTAYDISYIQDELGLETSEVLPPADLVAEIRRLRHVEESYVAMTAKSDPEPEVHAPTARKRYAHRSGSMGGGVIYHEFDGGQQYNVLWTGGVEMPGPDGEYDQEDIDRFVAEGTWIEVPVTSCDSTALYEHFCSFAWGRNYRQLSSHMRAQMYDRAVAFIDNIKLAPPKLNEGEKAPIRELALACGFKLKDQGNGVADLNPYVYEFAARLMSGSSGTDFQSRARPWLVACFGEAQLSDTHNRSDRFMEEAAELYQARGGNLADYIILGQYVFGRPVGQTSQEVGGVMLTLACLCLNEGINMHDCADTELARVWGKLEVIRQKDAQRIAGQPLPGSAE
jgi:hypothetical protein